MKRCVFIHVCVCVYCIYIYISDVVSYQQQEAVLEVLVGLDAAVLRPLVVQRARGVEEGHVPVPARAQVHLLQLQPVGCVQVLLGAPQHPAIQRLACRGRQRDLFISARSRTKGTLRKWKTQEV